MFIGRNAFLAVLQLFDAIRHQWYLNMIFSLATAFETAYKNFGRSIWLFTNSFRLFQMYSSYIVGTFDTKL